MHAWDSRLQPLLDRLGVEFGDKGKEVVENNRKSALAGYRYFKDHFKGVCPHTIPFAPATEKKMMLNGSQAMALGAICSGVKFYAGYPMSPSTPIMEFIASMAKDYNIVLEPAEDEIAAINMVIGASFAGARAMTATSGGGFCLMVEGLGSGRDDRDARCGCRCAEAGSLYRTSHEDRTGGPALCHSRGPRRISAGGLCAGKCRKQAFFSDGKGLQHG